MQSIASSVSCVDIYGSSFEQCKDVHYLNYIARHGHMNFKIQ